MRKSRQTRVIMSDKYIVVNTMGEVRLVMAREKVH